MRQQDKAHREMHEWTIKIKEKWKRYKAKER
jgi:hypothetical protein